MALLAACSGPAAPPAATPAPTTSKPSATAASAPTPVSAVPTATAVAAGTQPRTGGTLRIGILGDLTTLDGHQAFPAYVDHLGWVWDTLATYDEKRVMQPTLAESWDFSPDAKVLTFKLRKGVTFHTGRELTAQDVQWNFVRAANPKEANGFLAPKLTLLDGVDTPDKYTAVVRFKQPYAGVWDFIEYFAILDPVSMQEPDGINKPVGTGPFSFAERIQGDHLKLLRNRNYWQAGKPYVDEVVAQIYADGQSMIAAFEAAALEIADNPSIPDTARLQKDTRYQVLLNPLTGGYQIMLANVSVPPTDKKLFRQALNYALDRQRIVDSVLLGLGQAQALPWGPSAPSYDSAKAKVYAFDLDKARAALQQSGATDPDLDLVYASTSAEHARIGQIYQADLAKTGVKLNLKPTEPAQLNAISRRHLPWAVHRHRRARKQRRGVSDDGSVLQQPQQSCRLQGRGIYEVRQRRQRGSRCGAAETVR
jgi:peptide/nickel transport system substrate-binding protein